MPKYKIVNPCFLYGEIHKEGSIDAQVEDVQPLVDSGSLVLADDDQIDFNSTAEADRLAIQAEFEALCRRAKELGVEQYDLLNKDGLEAAIANAEQKLNDAKAKRDELIKKCLEIECPFNPNDHTDDELLAALEAYELAAKASAAPNTATLVGGITKDGRIVELKDWKVPDLKKLAVDLEVKNANQLNKDSLIEAITAVEFAAEQVNA